MPWSCRRSITSSSQAKSHESSVGCRRAQEKMREGDDVDPGLAHQPDVVVPDLRVPLVGVVVGPEAERSASALGSRAESGHRTHAGRLMQVVRGGGAVLSRTTRCGRHQTLLVLVLAGLDLADQRVDRAPADLVERLVDGGERRPEVRRLLHVVEADHADVVGHPATALVQGPQQPQRHLVVRGEHRGHLVVAGQPEAGLVAGAGRPVARQHGRHRAAVGLEGLLPRRPAAPRGVRQLGTRDVPDGLVPEVEQVLGGQAGAVGLVVVDDRVVVLRAGVDHDDRAARPARRRRRRAGASRPG